MSLRKEIRENPSMGYLLYTRLICPLKSFLNSKLLELGETNVKIDDFYDEDAIFKFISDTPFSVIKHKHMKNRRSKLPWNQVKHSISPYIIFTMEMRKKFREEDPNNKSVCQQSKVLSKMWKEATPEFKKKYEDLAKIDRDRYLKQREEVIAEYNRHRIAKPKKPTLPWILFMKNTHNRDKAGDSSKRGGVRTMVMYQELYKNLTDEERAVYIDMANKDKIRYNQEMELYLEQIRENRKNKMNLESDEDTNDDDEIIINQDDDDDDEVITNPDEDDNNVKKGKKSKKTLNLKDEEELEITE